MTYSTWYWNNHLEFEILEIHAIKTRNLFKNCGKTINDGFGSFANI
jgi:hypothetical protein